MVAINESKNIVGSYEIMGHEKFMVSAQSYCKREVELPISVYPYIYD